MIRAETGRAVPDAGDRWGSNRSAVIAFGKAEISGEMRAKNPVDGVGLFVKFRARLMDLEQQAYCI